MDKIGYGIISNSYEELYCEEQTKKIKAVLSVFRFDQNKILLDVGCGTGIGSGMIKCCKAGIDPCIELLSQCKSGLVRILGAGEKLPFQNKSFDYIISLTAIHNFKDYRKGIDEMLRVAKDAVIISVLKRSSKFGCIAKYLNKKRKDYIIADEIDDQKDKIFILRALKEEDRILRKKKGGK